MLDGALAEPGPSCWRWTCSRWAASRAFSPARRPTMPRPTRPPPEALAMLNIVMIGCGAIGAGVLELLENDPQLRVDAVIVPRDSETQVRHRLASLRRPPRVLSALPAGERPDLLVECAGHPRHRAARAAGAGPRHSLPGGLGGRAVRAGPAERLEVAAQAGGSRIELLPGAIGAIDALSAARVGGLESVRYTGRKPASAWLGTPGETVLRPAAPGEGAGDLRRQRPRGGAALSEERQCRRHPVARRPRPGPHPGAPDRRPRKLRERAPGGSRATPSAASN